MHVIATAGHVDHGKSTLVKALTGSEPDRLAEERARGLSIELGYVWTSLPPVGDVAFVDVPGHERFVPTMLSGVGPVPAVLLVVAADDPWMPQAAEHLAALEALGVRHAVVAVNRSDLADPSAMVERAGREVDGTGLAGARVVPVSARTGAGLDDLRRALVDLIAGLPTPEPAADVRLWVDRCFTVRGAGTVVTGTLPAGRIAVGDTLAAGSSSLRVRGLQSLGRPVTAAAGVARVAVNVAGEDRSELDRHSVLVTPGAWRFTDRVDVRIRVGDRAPAGRPPRRPVLHVGAAAVAAYLRPLSDDLVRLTLDRPLPLRIGDRALLRDPGSRRLWGLTVLDPAPPALGRRGASRARAAALAAHEGEADAAAEIERRGLVHLSLLRQLGVPVADTLRSQATADGWLLAGREAERLRPELAALVRSHDASGSLTPGIPRAALSEQLGLPSAELVSLLVAPPLREVGGRITAVPERSATGLPEGLERAVAAVEAQLREEPFAAPTAERLSALGLDARAVAVAGRAGRLLHLGSGVVLLPGADRRAVESLRQLGQPFTTSEARSLLGTTRRVVLPLLQHLDRQGSTRRHPDDRRSVVGSGHQPAGSGRPSE